ncbi:class I SAM-dependent methyltransferase [Candidatus Woesearchaeota archaeon]|nr:class I SAM-dependent methyltransferase [Candidatus Woesearchaeota archaeon]
MEKNTFKELQKYFRGEKVKPKAMKDISEFKDLCIMGSMSYAYAGGGCFADLTKLYIGQHGDYFGDVLRGRRVIEIGAFDKPLADIVLELGAKEYVAVDSSRGMIERTKSMLKGKKRCRVVFSDALKYLCKQRDGSAIVVSSGVITLETIRNPDYIRFLVQEIRRVTPEGGCTFHTIGKGDILYKDYFYNGGFRQPCYSFNKWVAEQAVILEK